MTFATTTDVYHAGRADALDEAQAFAMASAHEFRGLAVRGAIGDPAAEAFRRIWESVADHIATLGRGDAGQAGAQA